MVMSAAEVKDPEWVGGRVQGRLLVRDTDGRAVLLPGPGGYGGVLPGGPLGQTPSLVQATREHAGAQLGVPVIVGVPRLLTLSGAEGLVVVFDGSVRQGHDVGSAIGIGSVVDVVDAVDRAREAGRVFYRETLWWVPGPIRGHGGLPAPSPGERLAEWVDADIAMWLVGVALGVFPVTASFTSVRSIVSSADAVSDALHRVPMVLADAGILEDEDGSGAEFRWSPTVDRTGC